MLTRRDHALPFGTLGTATLCLLAVSMWALCHAYAGLFHDAGLYTLLALARLHPESLRLDVFLKFGSQDGFTLFSPLYAGLCGWLGVEAAAAVLTLLCQAALVTGAWLLARTVLPAPAALLGTLFVLALPGDYGPARIFTCIEPFLTPRMGAEALVLGALAAALSGRKFAAAALTLAALAVHPLMAMAGVGALALLYGGMRKPVVTAALVIVGAKALVLAAFIMPSGPWGRFDLPWLALLKTRSPYLFLRFWDIDDWSRVAVTLATLVVGWRALPEERARLLCLITLLTLLGGVLLTLLGCDLLHLVFVTRLQPWRWQWLGTVVAALTLPSIVTSSLASSALAGGTARARTTLPLLIAAWVFGANLYGAVAAVLALASLAYIHRLKVAEARWLAWGAGALLSLAVVWRVATNLEFTAAYYLEPSLPLWLRRVMSFAHDGSAAMAVLGGVAWLANAARPTAAPRSRTRATLGLAAAAIAAAALCGALAPFTYAAWTTPQFSPQRQTELAGWRALIPPGAEVFWPEAPVAAWTLLQRPSYLSVLQTSGMVFSRAAAMELERRANALSAVIPPAAFMDWSAGTGLMLSREQLEAVCRTGEFAYLVTAAPLSAAPLASTRNLQLYRCAAAST